MHREPGEQGWKGKVLKFQSWAAEMARQTQEGF